MEYEKLVREQGYQSATQGKIPVSVGLTAEQGHPHPGVIDFRDNRVDPGTGTILLRAVLPNPDRVLTPGLFARVRAPIGKPRQRLLVPELALQTDQRGRSVLVVRADHTVEQRVVVPGAGQEGGLIVIESGLTADDWVVVNGLQRARPGSKVEPQKAVASPPVAKAAPKR